MWEITVRHGGMGQTKTFRGRDKYLVEQRARNQEIRWEDQWLRRQASASKAADVQARRDANAASQEEARQLTEEARTLVESWQRVLSTELSTVLVNWKNTPVPFGVPEPTPQATLTEPDAPSTIHPEWEKAQVESRFVARCNREIGPPPGPDDANFRVGGFGSVFKTAGHRARLHTKQIEFQTATAQWNLQAAKLRGKIEAEVSGEIQTTRRTYETDRQRVIDANAEIERRNAAQLAKWKQEKESHEKTEKKSAVEMRALEAAYKAGKKAGVERFMSLLRRALQWPEFVSGDFEFEFIQDSSSLVVDFELPSPDDVPVLREVRYVQSRRELVEVPLKQKERDSLYDQAVYQLVLKLLHDILHADQEGVVGGITVNGIVESVNRAKGKNAVTCILSIQATREHLLDIDFPNVDARACFKALKGVGSSQLFSLAPVPPIVRLNTKDRRFVENRETILSEGTNLATMDWENFEHLVRELFEKEFTGNGAEVKITRASRDAGVDAVVFDPDPIRGGKIVIQAKRYTHTVDVSAVRDLYGTVLNEGANTGILVTTSEYGPDAYHFAKDKPLKLLTGGNLLHLLHKHGYKAYLDLAEARKLLKEQGLTGGRFVGKSGRESTRKEQGN